jgi:hypothetical protein
MKYAPGHDKEECSSQDSFKEDKYTGELELDDVALGNMCDKPVEIF